MGHSKLQRTILRRFRLLVFDQTVTENGTVAFSTALTTKIFPLLTSNLDPQQAAETRRRLLNQVVNERIMVIAYHMPFPALGHIRLQNGVSNTANITCYEWEPILWQFEP